ncbi:MAG: hypothetical protein LBO06_07440 [Bacteroidales bacterium]|jgi:hypothetical protein|nr:hypothetical protein [Bacteroidales bacterium]
MKFKVLLSLFLAGFAFCGIAQAQNATTDLEKNGLKGKVKSVKTVEYFAVTKTNGDQTTIEKGDAVKHGKSGKTEMVEEYDQNGVKNGAAVQGEIVDSWAYNTVASTKTYQYNADGSLKAGDWKPASSYYTYRTNEQGASLERNTYSDGQIYTEVLSRFDVNGNKISDRSSSQNVVFKYDNNGNKSEKTVSDRDGKILFQYTYFYEYDQNSNWTKCIEMLFGNPVKIVERAVIYY